MHPSLHPRKDGCAATERLEGLAQRTSQRIALVRVAHRALRKRQRAVIAQGLQKGGETPTTAALAPTQPPLLRFCPHTRRVLAQRFGRWGRRRLGVVVVVATVVVTVVVVSLSPPLPLPRACHPQWLSANLICGGHACHLVWAASLGRVGLKEVLDYAVQGVVAAHYSDISAALWAVTFDIHPFAVARSTK
eukprot:1244887-Prymnesium_polylepis.2